MTSTPERDRYACALRYRPREDRAPRVVAAGRGRLAERIVSEAVKAGVPVREDADLARALSRLEVLEEIPEELYRPVAVLLAAVYEAAGRLSGGGRELSPPAPSADSRKPPPGTSPPAARPPAGARRP